MKKVGVGFFQSVAIRLPCAFIVASFLFWANDGRAQSFQVSSVQPISEVQPAESDSVVAVTADTYGLSQTSYNSTNEVGHAFWQLRTEAPDDALQYISPSLVSFLNKKWGFSPINGLFTVPGVLQDDSGHSYNIKRTFYISFNGLLNGLINTRSISNAPPVYSLYGFNCVSAARQTGYFSGVHVLPADMSPQNFGVTLMQMYPPILSSDPFDDETDLFYSPNLW